MSVALITLLLIMLGLFFRRAFIIVIVKGNSMLPFLEPESRLLVLRYHIPAHFKKGGLVVFRSFPFTEATLSSSGVVIDDEKLPRLLVKRIVGLPKETISLVQLEEIQGIKGLEPVVVPEGHIFVQSDHKFGMDSRHFGPVPFSKVVGIPIMRLSPKKTVDRIILDSSETPLVYNSPSNTSSHE